MMKNVMIALLFASTSVFASIPYNTETIKTGVLMITDDQVIINIPQFCYKYGEVLAEIATMAVEPTMKYTKEKGVVYVVESMKQFALNVNLSIPDDYIYFAQQTIPGVPLMSTFKTRLKFPISDEDSYGIRDIGIDVCIESLYALDK